MVKPCMGSTHHRRVPGTTQAAMTIILDYDFNNQLF